jgi:hypothetical protein
MLLSVLNLEKVILTVLLKVLISGTRLVFLTTRLLPVLLTTVELKL